MPTVEWRQLFILFAILDRRAATAELWSSTETLLNLVINLQYLFLQYKLSIEIQVTVRSWESTNTKYVTKATTMRYMLRLYG